MFLELKVQNIFLSTVIVITLIFSSLFTFIYLSPDQSNYVNDDRRQTIDQLINSNHRKKFETIKTNCFNNEFKPFFNKMVFIVIDAFRSDFVNSIAKDEIKEKFNFSMPFVEKLLNEKKGLSAISRAKTPTVTLPKLKSILSGSTSNFIDILFNLNSASEFGTDNLIKQALNKNKRIIFYGDDTWLQMFDRSLFIRSNETVSFFARDYTTVDTNVTENMLPELNKTAEWDILILHYLGVDHIGHNYGGINSKLLPNKLIEMDNVVKVIYENLSRLNEDFLIFLTGDHGMTDLGNHGGNTIEETNTAVLLFTTNSNYQINKNSKTIIKIEQNDIATLLSFYLGLKIPLKSKGKLDLSLVNSFGNLNNSKFNQIKLCYLFKNTLQLQKMEDVASMQFLNYFLRSIENHFNLIQNNYQNYKQLKEAEQNYDQYLNIIQRSLLDIKNENQNQNTLILSILVQMIIFIILIVYQVNFKSFIFKEIFYIRNLHSCISIVATVLNILLLGSTSFIEAEHFYFNYIVSSLIILHGLIVNCNHNLNIQMIRTYFSVLLCLLISSNWTNLIDFINSSTNSETSQKTILFIIIGISFSIINYYLTFTSKSKLTKWFTMFILVQTFIFK